MGNIQTLNTNDNSIENKKVILEEHGKLLNEIKRLKQCLLEKNIVYKKTKQNLIKENSELAKKHLESDTSLYELNQKINSLSKMNKALRDSKHIANEQSLKLSIENTNIKRELDTFKNCYMTKATESEKQFQAKDESMEKRLQSQQNDFDAKIHELKQEHQIKLKKYEELQNQYRKLTLQNEHNVSKKDMYRNEYKELIKDYNRLNEEMTEFISELSDKTEQNHNLRKENKNLKDKNEDLEVQLHVQETEYNKTITSLKKENEIDYDFNMLIIKEQKEKYETLYKHTSELKDSILNIGKIYYNNRIKEMKLIKEILTTKKNDELIDKHCKHCEEFEENLEKIQNKINTINQLDNKL